MSPDGIDPKLVDRSCKMLRKQVDQAFPIINTFTGSRVAAVGEWVDGQPHKQRGALRSFQDMSTHMAVALAASAIDNAEAFGDALDEPDGHVRVWAYLTLARAVVEAAVRFAHLTDTTTTPVQRILRAAAMVYSGLDERRKLVNEFDDVSASGQVTQDLAAWERQAAKAGIKPHLNGKGRRIGVERGAEVAPFSISITDESASRMTRNVAPYRIGSAVTHSAWWFLASSLPLEGGRMVPTPDSNIVITAVGLTLESFEVMAVACAATSQAEAVKDLSRSTDTRMRTLARYAEVPMGATLSLDR